MHDTIKARTRSVITISTILICIGIVFVYSASSMFALAHYGSSHYYALRQGWGIVLGVCTALLLRYIPLRAIRRLALPAFLVALALTTMTLLPSFAVKIHGANRWIKFGGISFQPSEFLKITFIVYVAALLADKQRHITSFKRGYFHVLCLISVVSIILLLQPDFGLTITLATTALMMLFVAGARVRHIVATGILSIPVCALLVFFKPYRLKRIITFLNPWADPQGAGFQIIQSLIAIGSGGWLGVGIGNSKQKFFYLPMQHTDFIFAIIAEETGFIGVSILILLYCSLLYNGVKLALLLPDFFCRYTVLGFVLLTTLQTLINGAVTTGVVPTKGVGLPFISYGNTALVCSIAALGLIVNMATLRGANSPYEAR